MKKTANLAKHLSALAFGLALSVSAQAQLTGTLAVPSVGYPTLASAITALNTQGVGAGGVTVNVTAAQTAPAGGYILGSATLNTGIKSTSVARPIIINGNSNTVTAFTGTSTTTDGIFQLAGADWVTINALHLVEAAGNATPTTRMEWGYALVKRQSATPFDGCQNNTIKNCNVSLNRLNTNSVGIYAGNHIATTTSSLSISQVTDANSYNTFSGNILSNVYSGISLNGFSQASPYAAYDQGNIVGGSTASTGNTIENFAGTTNTGYGINLNYQNNFDVRKNTIANAAGNGGVTAAGSVYGVNLLGPGSNGTIVGNNLNLSNGSTSISYHINANSSAESLAIDSNNLGIVSTSSGGIYGIYALGSLTNLTMNANSLRNATITGTGTMYLFYPNTTSKVGGKLSVNDNKVTELTRSATGTTYCIYQTSSIAADSIEVRRNKFSGIDVSGSFYTIYMYGGAAPYPVRTFQYDTAQNVNTGTGVFYGINTYNMSTGSDISYNNFSNITCGSTMYGIYNSTTNTNGLSVHHNKLSGFQNTNASSSTNYLLYTGGANIKIYNNLITDLEAAFTTSGTIYGLYITGGNGADVYNNNISDLRSPAASILAPIYGMYLASGSDMNIYNNTVNLNATSTGANFGATGLYYASTINSVDIRNNIFRVNVTPSGTGFTTALRRSVGTNGVSPTNLALTSNSNIYYVPMAINAWLYGEGTSATVMNNAYNITNDLSFNTPCGLFKTFMTPRENASYTENNLVATGTTAGVFAPSGSSYAKSNSVASALVTNDFYGTTRPALADVGAVQFTGTSLDAAGPLISYTPVQTPFYCNVVPVITAIITDLSGVNTAAGTRPRMYFKKSTNANAFGGANNSSFNGWKWVEGTGTGPAFTFSPNYALLTSGLIPNDSIQYFVVAQDNAGTPNVGTVLAVYPTGYCPSSVALPAAAGPINTTTIPTNGYSYLPVPSFAATVNPNSLCIAGDVTLNLNQATNGLTIQWQSAPITGGTFTNLPGKTNVSDTLQNVFTPRVYRAQLRCGATLVYTTNVDTLKVINPQLLSLTPAGRCGPGTVTLGATASPGSDISWYTSLTGGAAVAMGPGFITPSLSSTTTYYATASAGGSGGSNLINTGVQNNAGSGTGGTMFDINAVTGFTLDSVETTFYAAGSQSFDIYIRSGTHCGFQSSASGWTLMSSNTTTVTSTTLPTLFALSTPVTIPAGVTGVYFAYNARYISTTACNSLVTTNADMTILGGSVVGSLFGSSLARSFAGSLIYHKGCESARTPVKAFIGNTVTASTTAAGPTDICSGDSLTLSAQPTAPAYTYQWRLNGAPIAGATGTQYTAQTAGSYTVITNTVPGCANTSPVATNITIKQVPKTITPGGPIVFCIGGQETLYGPIGTGLSYQWLNNGLPIAGATTQSLIITTSGNYRVRVTSATLGCSDTSIVVNVSVQTSPPATITTNGFTSVCPNSGLLLSGPAITGLQYQWRLNGYNINGATGQTFQAVTAGTYTLAVDVGPNCNAISAPLVLSAGTLPPTTFTPPIPTLCAGSAVTLQASIGNYTYQWLNSTGVISGATAPTYTLNSVGTYRLKITSNTNGCTDTSAPRSVASAPLPTVSLTPSGPATLCYIDSTRLSSISSTSVEWQWYVNGNSISGANASSFFAGKIQGLYTVRVKDVNGCQSNPSNAFNLTVIPPSTANITYNSKLTFCEGGAIVLNAQTEAGNRTQWITNGVAIPNDTLLYKQVATSGSYRISVRNPVNGCISLSNAVPVTVLPAPIPLIARSGNILSVANGPFLAYQWYRNNQLILGANQSSYVVTSNNGYSVQVVEANGCEARSETQIVGTISSVINTPAGTIRLYPNPTSNLLYVDAPMAISLTVRDVTGRVVATSQKANTVELGNLADGLYMVYVTDVKGQILAVEKVTKTTGK